MDDILFVDYEVLVEAVMEKHTIQEMVVQEQQILVEVDEVHPEQEQQLDMTEVQV